MEDEYACFSKNSVDNKGTIEGFAPQAISVVRTVLDRCKKECEQNALQVPLNQLEARVAYYTSYPPAIISQLKDHTDKGDQDSMKEFNVAQRIIFIKILQNFYLTEKAPTYADVYQMTEKSMEISSFYQFCKDLYKFGFSYKPTINGYILTEDPKIRFERFLFLNKIKKIRSEGTPICYIDERIIGLKQMFQRPEDNVGNRELITSDGHYILLHAICDKEIKNSLFSNVISKELFTKWIFDVVLKAITPGCVIVMDNHPLHGQLINNEITSYNTKQEMLKYLQLNNVPCNEDMHKAELYELAQKVTRKEKFYDIDRLLKAFGHEVLRLPFGCKNLSITELVWNHLSTNFDIMIEKHQSPLSIKFQVMESLLAILASNGNEFENLIISWENELLSLDIMTEKILDKSFQFDVSKILANSES